MSDELDQATRDELEQDIATRTAFVATLPEGSLALATHSEGIAKRIAQLASLLPPPPKAKAVLTPPADINPTI